MPYLRVVSIDISKDVITVYFYNDGEMSNDLQNEYHSTSSEIIADFNVATIDEKLTRLDYLKKITAAAIIIQFSPLENF